MSDAELWTAVALVVTLGGMWSFLAIVQGPLDALLMIGIWGLAAVLLAYYSDATRPLAVISLMLAGWYARDAVSQEVRSNQRTIDRLTERTAEAEAELAQVKGRQSES